MNVLFISHDASCTGAPLSLLSLLHTIKDNHNDEIKFEILLLRDGKLVSEFEKLSTVFFLKKRKPLWKRIKKRYINNSIEYEPDFSFAKKGKYDLIFSNSIVSLSVACKIKQLTRTPILLNLHESEYMLSLWNITQQQLDYCNRLVVDSSIIKETLTTRYRINEEKINVVYPFSPIEDIIQKSITKNNEQDCFIVGLSGTASWIKGTDLLPIVMQRMNEKYPNINIKYVYVGQFFDDEEFQLRHDLTHINLNNRLIRTGLLENPLSQYLTFDVFLSLSREEAFSMACAENAMLGTPIICMDRCVGVAEELKKHKAVFTVPYLSIDGICDAIFKLWSDKELYNKISSNGKEYSLSHFCKEKTVNRIIEIIKKI